MALGRMSEFNRAEPEPPLVQAAGTTALRVEEEQERVWKQKIHQKLM